MSRQAEVSSNHVKVFSSLPLSKCCLLEKQKKKKLHFLCRSVSRSPLRLLYDTHISAFIIHDAAVAPQPGPCDQARCKSMYILHSVTELEFSSQCSSQHFHSPCFHFLRVSLSYEKWNTKKKEKTCASLLFELSGALITFFVFFSFHNIWIAAKTGWWATERALSVWPTVHDNHFYTSATAVAERCNMVLRRVEFGHFSEEKLLFVSKIGAMILFSAVAQMY